MKKLILSLFAIASLAFAANAVTNMIVKFNGEKTNIFNVDQVKQVYYREYIDGVTINGWVGNHSYVDLGLPSGTKWATYNVGATKPTEYGNYFAWGETKPKEDYNDSTYKWSKDTGEKNNSGRTIYEYTKYCTDSKYGTVDNKKVLDAEDDAATANWGSAWRMPTFEEMKELEESCEWDKDYLGYLGCDMYVFRGRSKVNGATIFLPYAGDRYNTDLSYAGLSGHYWSSSLSERSSYSAYCLYFYGYGISRDYDYRYNGHSVRAVLR